MIVTVTRKGQATIPVRLRKKHKIGRKVLVVDTKGGVLLKPLPDPSVENGSLRKLFVDTNSGALVDEARRVEYGRDHGPHEQR